MLVSNDKNYLNYTSMTDSKILITNYPNFYTHLTCSQTNNHNKARDIQCGWPDYSKKESADRFYRHTK